MPDVSRESNIAAVWWKARVSVVPIQANGTKRPTRDWSALQRRPLTQQEVDWYWRPGETVGVAAICGRVSGNLEMCELEAAATDAESLTRIKNACADRGVLDLWDSLTLQGYAEWTPSGGLHLLYRVPDHEIPGNTKLAATATGKTLAETRGEGGYVIVAPTSGACHPSGEAWTTVAGKQGVIPEISWASRNLLHEALTAALDQTPPPPPPVARREVAVHTGEDLRPGTIWEAEHDWDEPWFTDLGWRVSHRAGGETFWVRPGKDPRDGHSASTGYRGEKDRLYVFSTSTGLPSETPLTKFFVYSHYHHGGDMVAAARELRSRSVVASPQLRAYEVDIPDVPVHSEVSLPPQGGFDLSDTGSGRRMKELYGDTFRYITSTETWLRWDGSVWVKDQTRHIERAAIHVADEACAAAKRRLYDAESAGADKETLKMLQSHVTKAEGLKNRPKILNAIGMFAAQDGIAITLDMLDQDVNLLNLRNGTLNLETLELYDPQPENLQTKTMAVTLDKDAECPRWVTFMEDAFPDVSVRDYVQRALGYSLLGKADQRAIFMLHGPSGTGKSVLTNVIREVFGSYGVTAPAGTFRLKSQVETLDLNRLRGARFVTTSELPEGQALDEDLVKRFTGNDMVMSRGHYEDYEEWRPTAVVWLATNFLPRISSDDNAIWRRTKSVLMGTEFGSNGREEIFGYQDILMQEADGIFNWLLAGLEMFRLRALEEPDAITQGVLEYRTDVNTVASFLRDTVDEGALIRDGEGEIRSHTLRAMFEKYCLDNHTPVLGARRYANRLKALGLEPAKVGGVALWRGVRQDLEFGVLGSMRR